MYSVVVTARLVMDGFGPIAQKTYSVSRPLRGAVGALVFGAVQDALPPLEKVIRELANHDQGRTGRGIT